MREDERYLNFLIDASLPRSTKAVIKALGHDAVDVRDILPPASPDAEIASIALAGQKVLLNALNMETGNRISFDRVESLNLSYLIL